jgi:Spy/CpxP family protein refolding chaperone
MLGNKRGVVLAVIVLFTPGLVFGQEMMGGKWWQSERIAEELKITDDEKRQLNEIYTGSRRELITFKSNVERERFELDNLLDQRDAKRKDINDQYNRLETARSNLSTERFNLLMDIRDIVGIERYQQLKFLHRMKRDKKTKRYIDKKRQMND